MQPQQKNPRRDLLHPVGSVAADEKMYGGGDQQRQYNNVIIFGATFESRLCRYIDFSNKCNLQLLHVVCHSPVTKCIYGISFISLSDREV